MRSSLLSIRAAAALGVALASAGCTDDDTAIELETRLAGCSGLAAVSSLRDGHTHEVCIPTRDLALPPEGGLTYDTTISRAHSHRITLSKEQLASLLRGGSVAVTTTLVYGHTHRFTLQRLGPN